MTSSGKPVTFIILAGKSEVDSEPALWVYNTRKYMVFDMLEKIKGIETIDRIIISSNDRDFLEEAKPLDPRIIPDPFPSTQKLHFGGWLSERVERYKPASLFYWGAGASPFITRDLIESFCSSISAGQNIMYTNNFFSADWVAFTPANSALEINPPPLDNNLAYHLWQDCALRSIFIAPGVEIIGDVDTPADLLILAEHPRAGPRTAEYLKTLPLDTSRVKRLAELLPHRSDIFLAGRVGSALFRYLDTRCPCKFRIISEERGMRSWGRVKRKEVRSFLAEMIEKIGMEGVFSFIEETSRGAVIDSRVIFAHICKKVSKADRFFSDLGLYEEIKDPFVADFTRRVKESPIPILTGGHSLILGGLWALVSAYGELPAFY